jgi:hypothetical protein
MNAGATAEASTPGVEDIQWSSENDGGDHCDDGQYTDRDPAYDRVGCGYPDEGGASQDRHGQHRSHSDHASPAEPEQRGCRPGERRDEPAEPWNHLRSRASHRRHHHQDEDQVDERGEHHLLPSVWTQRGRFPEERNRSGQAQVEHLPLKFL